MSVLVSSVKVGCLGVPARAPVGEDVPDDLVGERVAVRDARGAASLCLCLRRRAEEPHEDGIRRRRGATAGTEGSQAHELDSRLFGVTLPAAGAFHVADQISTSKSFTTSGNRLCILSVFVLDEGVSTTAQKETDNVWMILPEGHGHHERAKSAWITQSVRVCATVDAYSGLADRFARVEGCEPVTVGFADIASVRHE